MNVVHLKHWKDLCIQVTLKEQKMQQALKVFSHFAFTIIKNYVQKMRLYKYF